MVSGSSFSSWSKNDPLMPCFDMGIHAVHFEWSGLSRISFGAVVPQNMMFLLLACPSSKKWASSLNQMWLRKQGLSSVLSWNHKHMITFLTLPPGMSLCCICILWGRDANLHCLSFTQTLGREITSSCDLPLTVFFETLTNWNFHSLNSIFSADLAVIL